MWFKTRGIYWPIVTISICVQLLSWSSWWMCSYDSANLIDIILVRRTYSVPVVSPGVIDIFVEAREPNYIAVLYIVIPLRSPWYNISSLFCIDGSLLWKDTSSSLKKGSTFRWLNRPLLEFGSLQFQRWLSLIKVISVYPSYKKKEMEMKLKNSNSSREVLNKIYIYLYIYIIF